MKLIWLILAFILLISSIVMLFQGDFIGAFILLGSISAFKRSGISICSLIGALILIDIFSD